MPQEYKSYLAIYLNQWDASLYKIAIEKVLEMLADYITLIGGWTLGFDLWKTRDGIHWIPVSLNGLGNPRNYGARMLFLSEKGNLYLGTANPFQGCEVWLKSGKAPYCQPSAETETGQAE